MTIDIVIPMGEEKEREISCFRLDRVSIWNALAARCLLIIWATDMLSALLVNKIECVLESGETHKMTSEKRVGRRYLWR